MTSNPIPAEPCYNPGHLPDNHTEIVYIMKRIVLMLFILLTMVLVACGGKPAAPDELIPVRLPMGYIPDPQYAPFYVAVEKGYFAEKGFAVEFDYSPETDGLALVGANELMMSVASGEQVLLARAQGLPVVYVTQWWQRFPVGVVAKAEAGIRTPADMVGRKVGLPGFYGASYVGLVGLLSANGLTLDDINANEIGFNQVESLVTDQSEAVVIYLNNEPIRLAEEGVDIDIIAVADYIALVSNGLVTNEKTIAENPQMVQDFVDAFLRGLRDTLANPDEAYEISKNFVEGLDDSRKGVLTASLPLWQADVLGHTEPASWQQTQDVLIEMGLLNGPLANLDQAYTNRFIDNATK